MHMHTTAQGFVETLDYILIEDTGPSSSSSSGGAAGGAEVLSVSRMPIREEAAQDVALPSWRTPSDHVSLLCDVRMR